MCKPLNSGVSGAVFLYSGGWDKELMEVAEMDTMYNLSCTHDRPGEFVP